MNLGTRTRRQIQQAARALRKFLQHNDHNNEEPRVFAVTHCYPTRLVLYAAAFQGGWKVHFMKSLRTAVEAASVDRPLAVFYDHDEDDGAWQKFCSSLSRDGVPFVFLARQSDDEDFLAVIAAGGYPVPGDPLTSEEIVKAVDFAGEVAALAHVSVV